MIDNKAIEDAVKAVHTDWSNQCRKCKDSPKVKVVYEPFIPFFERMSKEILFHMKEKGETWKTMSALSLEKLLSEIIGKYRTTDDDLQACDELVDLANVAAMVYLRLIPNLKYKEGIR